MRPGRRLKDMFLKFLRIFSSNSDRPGKKVTFLHAQHDGGDTVACDSLEVVISHDKDFWYAQGKQIDYIAQGQSIEEVKERFLRGLSLTVKAHIKKFGSVEKLLRGAPASAFEHDVEDIT